MTEKLTRSPSLKARHPGELLKSQFLAPSGITVNALAAALGVSGSTVSRVCQGKASITADFAQRLELALGASAEFWLNLQTKYDLWQARQSVPEVTRLRELEFA